MSTRDPAAYRPCVGAMLIDREGRVFVGKRFDSGEGDRWQMPQGGVDPGEDIQAAMLRELFEETGVSSGKLKIICSLEEELFYELPPYLKGKLWGGKYIGQRQTWFLVRFTGNDADVDLEAHAHPEFAAWKWVDPQTLPDIIVPFKKEVYRKVLEGFGDRF